MPASRPPLNPALAIFHLQRWASPPPPLSPSDSKDDSKDELLLASATAHPPFLAEQYGRGTAESRWGTAQGRRPIPALRVSILGGKDNLKAWCHSALRNGKAEKGRALLFHGVRARACACRGGVCAGTLHLWRIARLRWAEVSCSCVLSVEIEEKGRLFLTL